MKTLLAFAVVSVLGGCTWVKVNKTAQHVSLVKLAHVRDCKQMGTANASVKSQIGIIERKRDKVRDELIALAKNQAAALGGDTLVATSAIKDGGQNFDVYQCGKQ